MSSEFSFTAGLSCSCLSGTVSSCCVTAQHLGPHLSLPAALCLFGGRRGDALVFEDLALVVTPGGLLKLGSF